MQKKLFRSIILLILLNLLVKPVWIFVIDRQVQNLTGFSAYGQYFALLNLCIVFNFLLDLGISIYFNREVAAQQVNDVKLFSDSLTGKGWLIILYTLVIFSVAYLTGIREYKLLWMLIILQIGSSMLQFVRSYLTAAQYFRQDTIISVLDKLIVIILVWGIILFPNITGPISISRFVAIQVAGIAFSITVGILFLFRNIENFSIGPNFNFNKEIIFSGLPYAINIFLMTMMLRLDGFLLERLHANGAAEAGIYAAGFRLLDAFNMVGFLMAGFLLPFISRHWPDLKLFSPLLLTCRHLLMLGSLFVVAFSLAAPEYIPRLMYHLEDPYTVEIIKIILMALPALLLVHIYGTTLTATRNIKTFLYISFIFSMITILMNLIFIPAYGAKASAIIAVSVQSMYAITLIYFARKKTGIDPGLKFVPFYLAAGILCFVIIRITVKYNGPVLFNALISISLLIVIFFFKSGASFQQIKRLLIEK
ncbi:MAG: polysaccharide biosynthesis C-terminal domain-containing protein [Chitinophagaceae bacterium]